MRRLSQEVLQERQVRIMEVIGVLVDQRGRVDIAELGDRVGLSPSTIESYGMQLKQMGWSGIFTNHQRHSKNKNTRPRAPIGQRGLEWKEKPVERVNPALIARERNAGLEGMGDGRHEIDDPLIHGVWATPWSGKTHTFRSQTSAEACRRMLREYRKIRRNEMVAREPYRQQDFGGSSPSGRLPSAVHLQQSRSC